MLQELRRRDAANAEGGSMTRFTVFDEVCETTDTQEVVRAGLEEDGYMEWIDWQFLEDA